MPPPSPPPTPAIGPCFLSCPPHPPHSHAWRVWGPGPQLSLISFWCLGFFSDSLLVISSFLPFFPPSFLPSFLSRTKEKTKNQTHQLPLTSCFLTGPLGLLPVIFSPLLSHPLPPKSIQPFLTSQEHLEQTLSHGDLQRRETPLPLLGSFLEGQMDMD